MTMTPETRECQSCKISFVIDTEDFEFYAKMKVPPPTWCPECRMIRRFIWRNEHNLFRRKEDREGKEVFSSYPPSAPVKIYDIGVWNSDIWDPMEYGRDYDISRTFFEQLRELARTVPWPAREAVNFINSDYSNNGVDLKNSYLCFDASGLENCAYVIGATETKDSLDIYQTEHAELCYDNYMVDESYRIFFSVNCEDSQDIWFSQNMLGCSNCFGCVNLRNKNYYVFNTPYTKEKYKEFMEKFASGSWQAVRDIRAQAHEFWMQHPMRFTLGINNTDVTGEHIEHSKNVHQGFMIHEGENLKFCQFLGGPVSESYDYTVWGRKSSFMYETFGSGLDCERIKFSVGCYPASSEVEYSISCVSSSNLFGCVGLKKKQYCIFNKQYSKGEYLILRDKIIAHMNEMPYRDGLGREYKYGEFFPPEFSPFAYNETIAQDFLPLTKEQAEAKGFVWREPEQKEFTLTKQADELPDNIVDVPDGILSELIGCSNCKKAYRIIEMELAFYKRMKLPLPRLCPNCRFKERFKFVNPPKLWPGTCQCAGTGDVDAIYANIEPHAHGPTQCTNEFMTSYAPGRPEIIYCEQCYQAEVI